MIVLLAEFVRKMSGSEYAFKPIDIFITYEHLTPN